MRRTRRWVLGGLGGTVVGSVAGCASLTGGPSGAVPEYARRMPAPESLDRDHYGFRFGRLAEVPNVGERAERSSVYGFPLVLGIRPGSIQKALVVGEDSGIGGSALVYDGDVGPEFFTEDESRRQRIDRIGSSGEYEMWRLDWVRDAVLAARDGRIVLGVSHEDGAREAAQAAIDVSAGETTPYPDVDPACRDLLRAVGDGTIVHGRRHDPVAKFGGSIGEAVALRTTAEGADIVGAFVFENAGAASREPVANWIEVRWPKDGKGAPSPTVTGRLVTIEAGADSWYAATGALDLPSRYRLSPQANFEFRYDRGSGGRGLLKIFHSSGDHIPVSQLGLTGRGFAPVQGADQTRPGPWKGEASDTMDGESAVSAGDEVTVGVRDDYVIRVVHIDRDGDPLAELAVDRGPDA